MMYDIKQITGEDILIRYNDLKKEINRAMEHSDGEWTAVQIVEAGVVFEDNVATKLRLYKTSRWSE